MAISFVNKGISEGAGSAVLSCSTAATIGAGLPVNIYIDQNGVRKCIASALKTTSRNFGITVQAATAANQIIDVVVGGTATLAKSGGTTGQVITAVAVTGTCTTAAVAATSSATAIGLKSASFAAILY
jgi:hypothetical protein